MCKLGKLWTLGGLHHGLAFLVVVQKEDIQERFSPKVGLQKGDQ